MLTYSIKMNSNTNNHKKLKKLYEKPVNKLTFNEIVFFAQALEDNKLKRSTEKFFEDNPKFAAVFIKKYREHVKKVCPNANLNKAFDKGLNVNNLMGANANNTFKNFNEGNEPKRERNPPVIIEEAGILLNQNGGYKKKSRKKTTKRRPSRKTKKIKRKVHSVPRGGKYVIIKGKKKYL